MNKQIAKQLLEISRTTPIVFEWTEIPEVFTAEELRLTPIGDYMQLTPGASYTIPMPAMIAVEHKQQYKDAYKRNGWDGVKEYHRSVMNKIKLNDVN